MGIKKLGKLVIKKAIGGIKASNAKTDKYLSRAKGNLAKAGQKFAQAGVLAAEGDYYGAGKAAGGGAIKIIGKKNIKQAGHALLNKKQYHKVSMAGKAIKKADKVKSMVDEGDFVGAGMAAAPDAAKLSRHIQAADHHTKQAAMMYNYYNKPSIGGGGSKKPM